MARQSVLIMRYACDLQKTIAMCFGGLRFDKRAGVPAGAVMRPFDRACVQQSFAPRRPLQQRLKQLQCVLAGCVSINALGYPLARLFGHLAALDCSRPFRTDVPGNVDYCFATRGITYFQRKYVMLQVYCNDRRALQRRLLLCNTWNHIFSKKICSFARVL